MACGLYNDYCMDQQTERQPRTVTPTHAADNFIDKNFKKLAATGLGATLIGVAGLITNAQSRLEGVMLGIIGATGYIKLLKDNRK